MLQVLRGRKSGYAPVGMTKGEGDVSLRAVARTKGKDRAVESRISRKTSEIWAHPGVCGQDRDSILALLEVGGA
jgi:hypothetical protein